MPDKKKTPLKITCTSTDCDSGLHCFRATAKMIGQDEGGRCRECGTDLIRWERLHRRDAADAAHTFEALRNEYIRHHFWHKTIDQGALNHARRKGKKLLRLDVPKKIRQAIGAASPFRDGYQTSYEGNVIYYAQHATASCCRKCAAYWHGIPVGRPLTDDEIDYLATLAWMYVEERLPRLNEDPEYVPRIRSKKQIPADKPAEEPNDKRPEVHRRGVKDRSAKAPINRPTNREHPGEAHQH